MDEMLDRPHRAYCSHRSLITVVNSIVRVNKGLGRGASTGDHLWLGSWTANPAKGLNP